MILGQLMMGARQTKNAPLALKYLMRHYHQFIFVVVSLAHFLVGQDDHKDKHRTEEQKCTQIESYGMMVIKKAKILKIGKFVVGKIG